MAYNRSLLIILLLSINLFSNAQHKCGTSIYAEKLSAKYKDYSKARSKVNKETEDWIKENYHDQIKTIIKIPVVVHVVWRTNTENISDVQIFSQIDILNKDYRRQNIDTINTPNVWKNIAADCEIEFCLANTDPNGNTTTGINRVQTNVSSFSMNGNPVMSSSSGGSDPWDQDSYLNIWVCNLGSGLLGYASPPSSWPNPNDGVVIGYRYFGNTGTAQPPYHKGRTATHEIGHWFNLEHVWGPWGSCGNDQVSDTPIQEMENYSCPSFPSTSICSGQSNTPNGDMFMNYMDYTNDACMNLFTEGQKSRMIAAINQYRPNLLSHSLCEGGVSAINNDINSSKKIVKIIDVLGRVTREKKNIPIFYIYENGNVERKIIVD